MPHHLENLRMDGNLHHDIGAEFPEMKDKIFAMLCAG
jgi:hypothetical protein